MPVKKDVPLKEYNTFNIDVKTKFFTEVNSIEELLSVLNDKSYSAVPKLILGGGSNILLTGDFEGLVIKNNIKGIEIKEENDEYVFVKVYGGENWHQFVLHCIAKGWGGVENLSLIPGSVGAAPMQNIGAYGIELKDIFYSLEALNLETLKIETFDHEACQFGYRESVFKNIYKDKYFIYSVTFKLTKKHVFNTSYGAIQNTLDGMGVKELSIKAISDAVIKIRSNKLPDPKKLGNSGSFFKNPEITKDQFELLKLKFPEIVGYPLENSNVKVAAGWLVEKCGWKGKVVGQTGAHKDQALVLVNYGNATGNEVKELAFAIQKSVKEAFDIYLHPEVNII